MKGLDKILSVWHNAHMDPIVKLSAASAASQPRSSKTGRWVPGTSSGSSDPEPGTSLNSFTDAASGVTWEVGKVTYANHVTGTKKPRPVMVHSITANHGGTVSIVGTERGKTGTYTAYTRSHPLARNR